VFVCISQSGDNAATQPVTDPVSCSNLLGYLGLHVPVVLIQIYSEGVKFFPTQGGGQSFGPTLTFNKIRDKTPLSEQSCDCTIMTTLRLNYGMNDCKSQSLYSILVTEM